MTDITLTIWFRGKTDEEVTFTFDGSTSYDDFEKQLEYGLDKTNANTIDVVDFEIDDGITNEQEIEHDVLMDFIDALNNKDKWETVYDIFDYLVLDSYDYPIEVLNLLDYDGMDLDNMVDVLEGNSDVVLYYVDDPIENDRDLGMDFIYDVYNGFDELVKDCQNDKSIQKRMQYYLNGKCLSQYYNQDLDENGKEIDDIFDIYSDDEIWDVFSPSYLEDCFDYDSYGYDLRDNISYLEGGHYYIME